LAPQIVPGVGVRVFRDNLETEYGPKCQALLDSSGAEYVSFIDDDDLVVPDYVSTILAGLESRPDYVGFNVLYTENGEPQLPVTHSLAYPHWITGVDHLYRDIVHFNPIRRELAKQSAWTGGNAADGRWADGLRGLGIVRTQVFIDREMYLYRHVPEDTFEAPRVPLVEHPPLPDYSFVTWL
jgi:hypothetical protein